MAAISQNVTSHYLFVYNQLICLFPNESNAVQPGLIWSNLVSYGLIWFHMCPLGPIFL
jgi:hypothetical protein